VLKVSSVSLPQSQGNPAVENEQCLCSPQPKRLNIKMERLYMVDPRQGMIYPQLRQFRSTTAPASHGTGVWLRWGECHTHQQRIAFYLTAVTFWPRWKLGGRQPKRTLLPCVHSTTAEVTIRPHSTRRSSHRIAHASLSSQSSTADSNSHLAPKPNSHLRICRYAY
jgi:hypothetical protein